MHSHEIWPPRAFSYTVPAGKGFTVPASPDAVVLKLWALSGDGTCPGQLGDQTIDWRVLSRRHLRVRREVDRRWTGCPEGWLADVRFPAGTPVNSLFNDHAGPLSNVRVSGGDVITLELTADTWAVIQWNAPNGPGASSLSDSRRLSLRLPTGSNVAEILALFDLLVDWELTPVRSL